MLLRFAVRAAIVEMAAASRCPDHRIVELLALWNVDTSASTAADHLLGPKDEAQQRELETQQQRSDSWANFAAAVVDDHQLEEKSRLDLLPIP